MNPENATRWQTARTLADLGELTALFLEGAIGESPSHRGPPAPETTGLIPMLAACNRAGFVTHMSQPGIPVDANGSAQRADVSGFADGETFASLATSLADSDLIITAARAPRGNDSLGAFVNITRYRGDPVTWDGGAESRDDLEYHYGRVCHTDAVRAICDAWQVTIIDPEWGRNDQLWPLLEKFAAQQGKQRLPDRTAL